MTTLKNSSLREHLEDAHRLGIRVRPFTLLFHALFAVFFLHILVWPMVISYTCALAFDLWILLKSRRDPEQPSPLLLCIWIFILVQAAVAVWTLGAQAGFQYYLLAALPPGFFIPRRPLPAKIGYAVLVTLFYLACDVWLSDMEPLYPQPEGLLAWLRHINIVATCILLAGVSYAYSLSIKEATNALQRIASTDELTGLLNRRSFTKIAERESARSHRGKHPLSLILCDIDFFKRINDTYGHAAGDHVLQSVSNLLQGALREYDRIARWGGEEFIVLLPDSDAASAKKIAERLRSLVESNALLFEGQNIAVSMTLGVSQLATDENWHATTARADAALYHGKAGGRNRVELA